MFFNCDEFFSVFKVKLPNTQYFSEKTYQQQTHHARNSFLRNGKQPEKIEVTD